MTNASLSLTARVGAFIESRGLIQRGERVLVAVSGGKDSVCLLHVLRELGYSLEVAHFDHQTRGGESAQDAQFVRQTAEQLGLPFHLESRPVEREAREAGRSFEEYARWVRYDFLTSTATARGCAAIATGHHADDQAETVLMRLLRGTTPAGAAGIRAASEWGGVRVVRPLLEITREEILTFLSERSIAYREDCTNVDPHYVRNRVRHQLLPLLREQYNARVREALLRFADAERVDADLLDNLAAGAFQRCSVEEGAVVREAFRNEPEAIQRRVITLLSREAHVSEMPFDRVLAAVRFICEGATGEQFDLGAGMTLQNGRDVSKVVLSAAVETPCEYPLACPGVTTALGATFMVRVTGEAPPAPLRTYCTRRRQVFDADAAGCDLAVRRRRPGDAFTPFGMTGTKKVQDYFVDIGLPAFERDAQLILTGAGAILWIVGGAVSAHAAVTKNTRRYLEVVLVDATEKTAAVDGAADPRAR